MKASVATFAASCANKLRGQQTAAKRITVFLSSNPFREDLPQYQNAKTAIFITPTSDTMEITQAALRLLQEMYCAGIQYKKSGVIMSDIVDSAAIPQDLFDPVKNRTNRGKLMRAMDEINHRYGLKTLRLAVEGEQKQAWKVRSEHRSPNYLTDINEILTIHI